jgi:hypothetical protein
MRFFCVVVLLAFVQGAGATRSDACDLVFIAEFPTREATRLTGIVIGFELVDGTTVSKAAPDAVRLPGADRGVEALRIAIHDVVSGGVSASETTVVPLSFGPDCRTLLGSYQRDYMQQTYPLGTLVAVHGRSAGSSMAVIVAESNRQEFVAKIPGTITRTSEGDLDFRKGNSNLNTFVEQFEFARVVLTLGRSRSTRYERLENLAFSSGWQYFRDARRRYSRLLSDSGLTAPQRQELLRRFDEERSTP